MDVWTSAIEGESMGLRKGFVYSIIAIMLISSLTLEYIVNYYNMRSNFNPTLLIVRGFEMKSTLNIFEQDFARAMKISGRRAAVALIRNITDIGVYTHNAPLAIVTLAYNGSGFMENATLLDWLNAFSDVVKYYKVNASFAILNYSLIPYPDKLLTLNYSVKIQIYLEDEIFKSYYLLNESFEVPLSFVEIEDPFVSLESDGYLRSKYILCDKETAKVSSHNYYYGYAYITYSSDLSSVNNKENKILITDTLNGKNNYDGFKGYVLINNYSNTSLKNYVAGVNINNILNNSLVVVSDTEVWITNHFSAYENASCYFRWNKGINLINRMEGNKSYSLEGIATFIPTSALPEYLIWSTDEQVIDSEYFST